MSIRARSHDTEFQCQKCSKFFSQKSSLTRHTKRCALDLPAPSRQKSCQGCANAKVRCSLKKPTCSRCAGRNMDCVYPLITTSSASSTGTPDSLSSPETHAFTSINSADKPPTPQIEDNLHLAQAINAAIFPAGALPAIRDHVLVSEYTEPSAPPSIGALARHTMGNVIRVHRSWVGMMARKEHLPPIIHPRQLAHGIPLEIMGTYLMAKVWDAVVDEKPDYVYSIAQREINSIHRRYMEDDERGLLNDLQALLIYAIILLFPRGLNKGDHSTEQSIFFKMQDIAYRLATTGLALDVETYGEIPTWEQWWITEAKRRTIMAVYQIGWAWSLRNNYLGFHCDELGFLEAPAGKALWQADTEEKWKEAYIAWKRKWGESPLVMKDLFDHPPGVIDLDRRTEMWLEDADEFGMLILSELGATLPGV